MANAAATQYERPKLGHGIPIKAKKRYGGSNTKQKCNGLGLAQDHSIARLG